MKSRIIFITVLIVAPFISAGPRVTGNGGDVIRCFGHERLFSLDYVMTQGSFGKKVNVVPFTKIQSSTARISNLLKNKWPELSVSFDEFMFDFQNQSVTSKKYNWFKTVDGLDDIFDEKFAQAPIPTSCRGGSMNGTIAVSQAIVRTVSQTGVINFEYDPEIITHLSKLQLSFLLVHEWLWNFSDSVTDNRKINYFLHSNLFEQVTEAQAKTMLTQFGLILPRRSLEQKRESNR